MPMRRPSTLPSSFDRPRKARLLQDKFGVKAVIGSHTELDKVEELAAQSDVVFSCATSDNLPPVQAILKGLKKRHDSTGDLPIILHTPGTGEFASPDKTSQIIYDDMNVEQMKSIPPTAWHRNVDLAVVEADEQGYARTYIVMPGNVYGIASGPLIDAGVSNQFSSAIPIMIRASLHRKQGGVMGSGKGIWPGIHVDDTADLYIVLFNAVRKSPESVGHGWEGFYIGENGEYTWYDIGKAAAKALVELRISATDEPTPFTEEEHKIYGTASAADFMSANTRCKASRSRSIGWKPTHTISDMFAGIRTEVKILAEKAQEASV